MPPGCGCWAPRGGWSAKRSTRGAHRAPDLPQVDRPLRPAGRVVVRGRWQRRLGRSGARAGRRGAEAGAGAASARGAAEDPRLPATRNGRAPAAGWRSCNAPCPECRRPAAPPFRRQTVRLPRPRAPATAVRHLGRRHHEGAMAGPGSPGRRPHGRGSRVQPLASAAAAGRRHGPRPRRGRFPDRPVHPPGVAPALPYVPLGSRFADTRAAAPGLALMAARRVPPGFATGRGRHPPPGDRGGLAVRPLRRCRRPNS